MTDLDRNWRYVIACLLIFCSSGLGVLVIFHPIPEASQRIIDGLFGGLLPITANAVTKAIDAARAQQDAGTIGTLTAKLPDAPTNVAPSPVTLTTPNSTTGDTQ